MDNTVLGILAEKLVQFGLTRQEANIYLCLLQNKDLSGYEVSKRTGISRSNVYSALASLVDKGAAYLLEGETNKYTAVLVEDFCENRIRQLARLKQELAAQIPQIRDNAEGYITIRGHRHIMDKIYNMLQHVVYRVYLSMPEAYLEQFRTPLEQLAAEGKKVVLLVSDASELKIKGCTLYLSSKKDRQLRLIVDSSYVLTGEMTGDITDSCLYCGQKNFVNVFKDSLRNEIRLIELTRAESSRNVQVVKGEKIQIMKKKAFVTKEQIEEIVKTYPTPFHIYDEKGIRENARALKEAFAWNKGFKEFFAVKATPNPFLINILREYGFGCDCSSLTELMLSDAIGVEGKDIMFSSNDTPAEEFAYAAKIGATINLDDITHIDFLEKTIGKLPETISCRYNPGGLFQITTDIMDNPGDAKYGFTTEQLFEGYRILQKKGVKNFGIHAFLASNTVTNEYYPTLAKTLFEVAVKLKNETGANIRFINLSGGIGIPYRPDQEPNDIRAIGEGVRKVYEEVLVPAGMGDVAIYTELGRFMMGPYGHLIVKAIHEKHTHKEYVGVDACAVNLMRPAMYGAYHHITVLGKEEEPCDHKYDITGSLCENNDKFAVDRMLPKIDMGDYLAIHDTGAHGFAMGYNYNGKLKSAELLLTEDNQVQLIRRAETPKDYFATFDCFDIYKKFGF